MGRRDFLLGLSLVMLLLMTACTPLRPAPPLPPTPTIFQVTGSSDLAPVVAAAQRCLSRQHPSFHLLYTPTNTTTGLQLLDQGAADIALASWLPRGEAPPYHVQPLGPDGVALIAHPAVGVKELDLTRARQVFSGRYLRWSELGGADVPIRLVSREEGSGTRAAVEQLLMEGEPVALTAVIMPGARDVVDYVARHEGALGYVSVRVADARVRVLALDGLLPSQDAVEKGIYPLTRATYAVFTDRGWALRDIFSPRPCAEEHTPGAQ